jgi:1,4-alpha-glucan branching enzyme
MNTTTETPGSLPRFNAKQSLHHATLFCNAPKAGHVALAGDFNDWNPMPMTRMPDGRWMANLELHHGFHQYIFLVDDKPVLDPNAYGRARNDQDEPVSLMALS